ncbi:uncharacterized protein LOC111000771 isoform X2 [Pieris rapae]|uniref:uncharacterized protein LOC111000771 isoform X2 n=2 Tax=Pieris rapae TaxID=64459 RepID=UPI001E27EBE1|nr:uncharacterized protein LOC111000771 isoform X2 [Pieris rapae]
MELRILLFHLVLVHSGYPPSGDEVIPGSVLLPATRRGRYLANIVRRQAVDGTGIKFNKDADRINAEAKKKVDVLSEELLPYIIAEQERRTTLYKRIMTAIQNGEKGVTIAEIRNKPPLIIRKGMLYRCPSNRAPKEPDGSGILMCEDSIEPSQVMYDSCLSAEDKELYVAENNYFFCNRHKIEGPDLPRNGSTVIGCAPIERTSLNYTNLKCALEDTDDVVVHYRYYPDRTYKFVTELDPDREVCDHWNPCQIGYIYSLPTPDQALLASELWHNYEDSLEEFVSPLCTEYSTSPRKVLIPEGYEFKAVKRKRPHSNQLEDLDDLSSPTYSLELSPDNTFVTVTLTFSPWAKTKDYGEYYVQFGSARRNKEKYVKLVILLGSMTTISYRTIELLQGQRANTSSIAFKCNRCRLLNVIVRASDSNIYNLDSSRYRLREYRDKEGKPKQLLEIEVEGMKTQDFGDYFAVIQNGEGLEERVKVLSVLTPEKDTENAIKIQRLSASFDVGGHFDRTMNYTCEECSVTDILCNGESVLSAGRVSVIHVTNMISFNFPRFEDNHACVYMGFFKNKNKFIKKILAVIDNNSPGVVIPEVVKLATPKIGEQFQQQVPFTCSDCSVEKVFVNGIPLETSFRRNSVGSIAIFTATSSEITISITEYTPTYEGVYQAVFASGSDAVTKTIMEMRDVAEVTQTQEETTAGTTIAVSESDVSAPESSVSDTATEAGAAETTEPAAAAT